MSELLGKANEMLCSRKLYFNSSDKLNFERNCLTSHIQQIKGSGTGRAGPVSAGPLFQGGSNYFSANQKSNAWLRIGLEYEPWNNSNSKVQKSSKLQRVKPSFETL